jgi:hypothetical protein
MRAERVRLTLLAVVRMLPACATKRYDVSAIGRPGPDGRVDGTRAKLELSGLRVTVESTDAVELPAHAATGAPAAARGLAVRLCFQAEELGYSFDPGRVVLRRDGEEFRASAAGGRAWIQPGTCTPLRFDAPVDERADQQLVLDGLARGRTAIGPVVLAVARKRVERRYLTKGGVDALTLPFKILLFPLAMYGGM